MSDFESWVWASVFASRFVAELADGLQEPEAVSNAFECATYCIEELRRLKIEPVFGDDCDVSAIETAVLERLGTDA